MLYSQANAPAVQNFLLHGRALRISGINSKPRGGIILARMNSKAPAPRRPIVVVGRRQKNTESVPVSVRIVDICDDFEPASFSFLIIVIVLSVRRERGTITRNENDGKRGPFGCGSRVRKKAG